MCKGGGGSQTVTQTSQPPPQFMAAYQDAVARAQGLANQPFQQYQGNLQAPLSPDQQAAIGNIQSAQGITAPYINSAADYINNSTAPLAPSLKPYQDSQSWWGTQAGINAQNIPNLENQFFTPANQNLNVEQGIGNQARGTVGPFQQLGSSQINQYLNPYLNQVVNATQAQFNNQNSQQANQLAGNAVSAGAFGGDREAIAQAALANQQQLAQAPVIAGLESQGYQQAVQTAQQQQAQQLATQQAQLQGLGLAGNLYQNSVNAHLQQAGLGLQGAGLQNQTYQNIANMLGQQGAQTLGANEANAWLNSQAGYGMANLGNQALNNTLTGANALLGVGGLEQQQAQQSLNIPYEQYMAAQSWPYQTAGWEANIAEGLGSAAGGTGTSSYPGPSVGSQVLGAGLTGAGILGMTGAFGKSGWLTGAGGAGAETGAWDLSSMAADAAGTSAARGGAIPHKKLAFGGIPGSGGVTLPQGMPNVPDVSMSIIPQGPAAHAGSGLMSGMMHPGSSSQTSGGGSGAQTAQNVIKDVASVAMLAALLNRGGSVHERASGGSAPVSISLKPGSYAGSPSVPHMDVGTGGGSVSAPPSGGMGAVNDYLANTAASAHPPPPPPAAPAPAAPGPAPASVDPSSGQPLATAGMMAYGMQLPVGMPLATGPYADFVNAFNATNMMHDVPGGGGSEGGGAGGGGGEGGMARGGEVRLDDGGVPGMGYEDAGPVFAGGMGSHSANDPWRALLYSGLGIMGGTSPNFGVNVGRGGLQGLQLAEQQRDREQRADSLAAWRQQQGQLGLMREKNLERHQNETEQQAAQRLADEAERWRQQLKQGDERLGLERENTGLRREEFNERTNQFWNGTMPWRQSNQDIALSRAVTSADQGQQRIDQSSQRIQNLEANRAANLQIRRDALARAQSKDEVQAIQKATDQVLSGARSIVFAHPEMKWDKAIELSQKSQGQVQSDAQPARATQHAAPQPAAPATPIAPPPAAIDLLRQKPELAPMFQQKYGIDPGQFLSPGG